MPVIFIIALLFSVLSLNRIMKNHNAEEISSSYYDQPAGNTDIAFVGTSMMMNAVYPMELWHDYGYVSFNLGSGNQTLRESYYLIKEVVERDHPSLVVVDCSRIIRDDASVKVPYLHYITDNMPLLSKNRIGLIREVSSQLDEEQVHALYFPLIEYHSRWTELTKYDFDKDEKIYSFGAKVDNRYTYSGDYEHYPVDKENAFNEESSAEMDRIIDYCRENDTELLLVTLPVLSFSKYISQKTYTRRVNAAAALEDFAAERQLDYLNLLEDYDDIGLDSQTDSVDGQHLNYTGALKLTDYLGRYIKAHYPVTDHRDESAYAYMDKAYGDYQDYLAEKLLNRTNHMELWLDAMISASKRDDTVIVITNRTDATEINPMTDYAASFKMLGLTGDFSKNYFAVIDCGAVVFEGNVEDPASGFIDKEERWHYVNNALDLKISLYPEEPAIVMDGSNLIRGTNGFQIVVYNKIKHDTMDSMSVDTTKTTYGLSHYYDLNRSFDN